MKWRFLGVWLLLLLRSALEGSSLEACQKPLPLASKISLSPQQFCVAVDTFDCYSLPTLRRSDFVWENLRTNPIDTAYWLHYSVMPDTREKGDRWVLVWPTLDVNELDIYACSGDSVKHLAFGTRFPFNARPYGLINTIVELPVQHGVPTEIYIRIRHNGLGSWHHTVEPQASFTNYATKEYLLLGIYYGILLIMALYNLLLYIQTRERLNIFYVGYVLACILVSTSEDGFGFQFIIPNHPEWIQIIDYFLSQKVFLLAYTFYVVFFLRLPSESKRLLWWSLGPSGLVFCYLLLTWLTPKLVLDIPGVYALPFLFLFITSVLRYREGYKASRYMIPGTALIFISMVILQLRYAGLIKADIFSVYNFNFAVLVETILFSLALSDRVKWLRKVQVQTQQVLIEELKRKEELKNSLIAQLRENERLKDKVNQELEGLVSERTLELEQERASLALANDKLSYAIEEMKKANIQLDLDNWNLKKEVGEEKKRRAISGILTYEEFAQIFTDAAACARYLEEKKWEPGYSCLSCGYTKYSSPQVFSRKCSRCGHVESVTAGTLFHRLRIPLEKAFYLVYRTVPPNESKTLEELVSELAIGKNTCWEFRKKVRDLMQQRIKEGRYHIGDSWEKLIV